MRKSEGFQIDVELFGIISLSSDCFGVHLISLIGALNDCLGPFVSQSNYAIVLITLFFYHQLLLSSIG